MRKNETDYILHEKLVQKWILFEGSWSFTPDGAPCIKLFALQVLEGRLMD